jgi:adenylate cyclase class 2
MSLEIEKKYRITPEQRDLVVEALNDYGADCQGDEFETNLLYIGGMIDENKSLLRVRQTEAKTTLTYKQSYQNFDGIKKHIEHEVIVSDAEKMQFILAGMGFELGMVYEKRRQTWKIAEIEVVIDELPFGLFIEIEGSLMEIAKAELMLEMEDFEVEHNSYPRLTKKHGSVNGNVIEARFVQSEELADNV